MSEELRLTRRSALLGAAGAAAAGLVPGVARAASASPDLHLNAQPALWRTAFENGLIYGSSIATWQNSDGYRKLFRREAALLWPEDDLLWFRLRPTPHSDLDFSFADRLFAYAEQNGQLIFGAPGLVWDEGFGEGWTEDDLFNMSEKRARRLLFGTVEAVVKRYKGRVVAWIVVNEAISPEGKAGLRTDVPWYQTIGPDYVAEAFHVAHAADPNALLVLNEFGYDTVNDFGDRPADKRRATLQVVDRLLDQKVPVHGFGLQAHLNAPHFMNRFHPHGYREFLRELADRGLKLFITEMDVKDDHLPADVTRRDRAVADIYARFLDAALAEPSVRALIQFGLTDRFTWLQEDFPRPDGVARRPLPFNARLDRKPAFFALQKALANAPERKPLWIPPKARRHP